MATVTDRPSAWNREESQRQVVHPLQRLRGAIRLYVALEGFLIFLVYLAIWFWLGLALDYGLFKVFTLDWVQEFPRTFRVVVLCGAVAGLVALVVGKVLVRLGREFRDIALALVLERRFSQLLGDRLITAVELADPRLAAQYGYSQAMMDETIREAAERVDRLSIQDVFDWKRLQKLALWVVALTVGILAVVGASYCAFARANARQFAWGFTDVAVIWFERNILLIDTIWPRQAHLELLDFPGDEIRVGRDAQPPTLHLRALKWVIADSNRRRAPEGWRALTWHDVTPELVGGPLPDLTLPAAWQDWTLDQIEMELDKSQVVGFQPASNIVALRDLLEQLEIRAGSPGMRRRLRKLDIPDEVEVYYQGASTRNNQTIQQGVNHEYTGAVADLKESVRFTVRGKDYYTSWKRIVVVPPPTIMQLTLDEAQPAYIYHRAPSGGSVADLRGKKHHFNDRLISLTGDTSRVDVPAGTDVVLRAKTDKVLRVPGVKILSPRQGVAPVNAVVDQVDGQTFQTRFDHVGSPIDMIYEFTDVDNVRGRRHVIIKPVEDLPPEVDVQIEVIRRTNQGYLTTAAALIPFSGKVRDDRGLAGIAYSFTLTKLEPEAERNNKAALIAGTVAAAGGSVASSLLGEPALIIKMQQGPAEDRTPKTAPMTSFERILREKAVKDVLLPEFLKALNEPPGEPLLKDFNVDPDLEFFAVDKLGLGVADEKAVQPHYRLRLGVTALDNNIETGPNSGQSKETFTVLVVSENELLAEIAKEEETLHLKLEEAVNRLKDGLIKLDNVAREMPGLKPVELSPMARRAEEIEDGLVKSWDATREVYTDYRRILKELKANRVQPGMINKVNDKICEPLDGAINVEFVQSDEAMRELQKKLESKINDPAASALARQQLQRLINRLNAVLDAMADVTTINQIIKQLVEISKKEQEEYDRLKELLRREEERVLESAGDEPKKPTNKK